MVSASAQDPRLWLPERWRQAVAEQDLDFYRRRVVEERQRETTAASPEARSAHALLAEIYSDKVAEIAGPSASIVDRKGT